MSRRNLHRPMGVTLIAGFAVVALVLTSSSASGAIVLGSSHPTISFRSHVVAGTPARHGLTWTQLTARPSPPGVSDAMMAYDAADGYVVLFGGYNTSSSAALSNQTWTYLGGTWTLLHPTISPTARAFGMMTYDPKDKYVLLYGGIGLGPNCQSGSSSSCNDTWTFSGGQWANVSTPTGPGPIDDASMTYDPQIGQVIMFGGDFSPGCACVTYVYTSLYAYSKGVWTTLHDGRGTKMPGSEVSVAYDSKDHYLVEFGGWSHPTTSFTNYTWNYTHGRWIKLHPSPSPSWRVLDTLVSDPKVGSLIMFGGLLWQGSAGSNDTWKYSGGTWTQLQPTTSPPRETYPAASAYDAADGYLLLFGGQGISGGPTNDTWVFG